MDENETDEQRVLTELREHTRRLADELPPPLRRIRVRAADAVVEVEWQEPVTVMAAPAVPQETAVLTPPPGNGPQPVLQSLHGEDLPSEDPPAPVIVASPMVGTFYRSPEPGADPFVAVGDAVEVGQVIGIVEAMKLMNPILAEAAGTVAEILVADAESVEFGQPLIALTTGG